MGGWHLLNLDDVAILGTFVLAWTKPYNLSSRLTDIVKMLYIITKEGQPPWVCV
jgi:hypothetical protein